MSNYIWGATVPQVEQCPTLTVLEVFEHELGGRAVWGDDQHDDNWPERTARLLVGLVLDAIYRDCQLSSVTSLWVVMVASEPQHALLLGPNCQTGDVMVSKNIYCYIMGIKVLDCGFRRFCI